MAREGLPSIARRAWGEHRDAICAAMELFRAYCGAEWDIGQPSTALALRLAVRVDAGRTPEEAAAREYLYCWKLALDAPIFGAPHALGM